MARTRRRPSRDFVHLSMRERVVLVCALVFVVAGLALLSSTQAHKRAKPQQGGVVNAARDRARESAAKGACERTPCHAARSHTPECARACTSAFCAPILTRACSRARARAVLERT